MLRQTPATSHPASSPTVWPPTKKRKGPTIQSIPRARTLPYALLPSPSVSSFSPSSSSSTASNELETGVDWGVPPIVCKEKEDRDMTTNLRARFWES